MRRYSAHAGLLIVEAKAYCPRRWRSDDGKPGSGNTASTANYLWVTTGVQVGALSDGAEPKIPGIISDEQSKIRPFSVVAR